MRGLLITRLNPQIFGLLLRYIEVTPPLITSRCLSLIKSSVIYCKILVLFIDETNFDLARIMMMFFLWCNIVTDSWEDREYLQFCRWLDVKNLKPLPWIFNIDPQTGPISSPVLRSGNPPIIRNQADSWVWWIWQVAAAASILPISHASKLRTKTHNKLHSNLTLTKQEQTTSTFCATITTFDRF